MYTSRYPTPDHVLDRNKSFSTDRINRGCILSGVVRSIPLTSDPLVAVRGAENGLVFLFYNDWRLVLGVFHD